MPRSHWGTSPRQSIEAEARRRGRPALVAGCLQLLRGERGDDDLVRALGGPPAEKVGTEGQDHWIRVWALRGLLWVWEPSASSAVVGALADGSWRVREMAAKVVARHQVDAAVQQLADLGGDENTRVRRAGERALQRLVGGG